MKAKKLEREEMKRFGPMRASVSSMRVVNTNAMNHNDIIGSLELRDDDPPHEREISGFVSIEVYDELLRRFNLLQADAAEKDVLIAQLHLELAQSKRDHIIRANRLISYEIKSDSEKN